jgi:hypothetical protein
MAVTIQYCYALPKIVSVDPLDGFYTFADGTVGCPYLSGRVVVGSSKAEVESAFANLPGFVGPFSSIFRQFPSGCQELTGPEVMVVIPGEGPEPYAPDAPNPLAGF